MTKQKGEKPKIAKKNPLQHGKEQSSKIIYYLPLVIFLLALLIRTVNLILISDNPYFENPVMDEFYHDEWAREIASGNWTVNIPFYRAPAYAFLLGAVYSVFGHNFFIARMIGSIFGALNCVLIFFLAKHLFNRKAGILAGIFACFYGMFLYYDSSLLTVYLEIFLYLMWLVWLVKAMEKPGLIPWLLSGLFFGLGAITRPNILVFIPVVILLIFYFYRKTNIIVKFRYAGIFLIGLLIFVSLVAYINLKHGNDFVLVAWNGGINFFLGNNESANGWSATSPMLRGTWFGGYNDAIIIAENSAGSNLHPSGVSAFWFQKGLEFIKTDFSGWISLTVKKAYLFLTNYEIPNNQSIKYIQGYSILQRLPLFSFLTAISLGLCGALFTIKRNKKRWILFLFMFTYTISMIAFFVNARYRMPIIPILIIFGAGGVLYFFQEIDRRKWKNVAAFGGLVLSVILLSTSNFYGIRFHESSSSHFSLGNQYASSSNFNRAVMEFELSIRSDPANVLAWNNLASALAQNGRYNEAYDALEMSLRYSENSTAYARMGLLLLRLERPEKAEECLIKAVELNPGDVESYYYLAYMEAERGNTDKALEFLDECFTREIDPRYAEMIYLLKGQIHLTRDEIQDAVESLQNAGDNPTTLMLLEQIENS